MNLKELINKALVDVAEDEDLCESYPRICAYATSEGYKANIVEKIRQTMIDNKLIDVFEAFDIVETTLTAPD